MIIMENGNFPIGVYLTPRNIKQKRYWNYIPIPFYGCLFY